MDGSVHPHHFRFVFFNLHLFFVFLLFEISTSTSVILLKTLVYIKYLNIFFFRRTTAVIEAMTCAPEYLHNLGGLPAVYPHIPLSSLDGCIST